MKQTITVHTLVKNEARYIWFAVMSVIEHVDKVLLWDTGSTDETLEIIESMTKISQGRKKIQLEKVDEVTATTFTQTRQKMLDATDTDWILMVDGDEVWWEDSIVRVVNAINEEKAESIVVPTINLVGDIYHFQDESLGQYHLAGRTGHLNLRGINRRIPGLHSYGPHGQWGWVDNENKMIQYRAAKNIMYVEAPYLHATNVPRSGELRKESHVPKRKMKRKYELGVPFPSDFYFPEVFFRPKPEVVPSPWVKRNTYFTARAVLETPLRKFKRKITKGKVGY